jgi:uncharacterized protein YneF (UPF0154 family)
MSTVSLILWTITCLLVGILVGMILMYVRLNWDKIKLGDV